MLKMYAHLVFLFLVLAQGALLDGTSFPGETTLLGTTPSTASFSCYKIHYDYPDAASGFYYVTNYGHVYFPGSSRPHSP